MNHSSIFVHPSSNTVETASGARVAHPFRPFSIKACAAFVAGEAHVRLDDVLNQRRNRQSVRLRAIVIRVAFEQGVSSKEIARRLNRNHATILHARDSWSKYVAAEPEVEAIYERLVSLRG